MGCNTLYTLTGTIMNKYIKKLNKLHKKNKSIVDYVEGMSTGALERCVTGLKDNYYGPDTNAAPDAVYDVLEDTLKAKKPKSKALIVGSALVELNKVPLPFYMGSMNKAKIDPVLEKFLLDNIAERYFLTDKMDGISAGYDSTGKTDTMTTRGNSNDGTGVDISHILPYLDIAIASNMQVRGELIVAIGIFEEYYSHKALGKKAGYANPRALVATISTRKDIPVFVKNGHCSFVAYDIIDDKMSTHVKWKCIQNHMEVDEPRVKQVTAKEINVEWLTAYMMKRNKHSRYEIDGIIVTANTIAPTISEGNPTHALAFKTIDATEIKKVVCTGIEWNDSRYGAIKPKVIIEPTQLGGVEVKQATAHNAKFINDNVIGKGAILNVVRSGDVIPYIVSVHKPAKVAGMPDPSTYTWGDTGVNIHASGQSDVQQVKAIEHFFCVLGVTGIKAATWASLYEVGYTTINKIMKIDKKALYGIRGFKEKKVETVWEGINHVRNDFGYDAVMYASGIFGSGMGLTALANIAIHLRDTIYEIDVKSERSRKGLAGELEKLDDIGPTRAKQFADCLGKFQKFETKMLNRGLVCLMIEAEKAVIIKQDSNEFKDRVFYITGVRDQAVKDFINKNGGQVLDSFKAATTDLIYKDGATNKKIDNFKGCKTPLSEFKTKYM